MPIEIKFIVVFAKTFGIVIIPMPVDESMIVVLLPPFILYVTVAFGVPEILYMASFPAQIGVAEVRLLTLGAVEAVRTMLDEVLVQPGKLVAIFV